MAPAGCQVHRHASRDSLLQKHDQSHTSHISFITSFWPYHITRHMLQEQVRRPLIVVASFYVAAIGF